MVTHPVSALLVCNGQPPGRRLAARFSRGVDLIVAADGGANACRRIGLAPDIIVGDLDSITPATRRVFRSSRIIRVRRQDNTDLEKAMDFLQARGVQSVVILGATGKRIDFTLGNLSVLWNYHPSMTITVADDDFLAVTLPTQSSFTAPVGTRVSLIPYTACLGITLKGLEYPLTNARLAVGEIAVSNVVRKSPFTVTVKSGRMLLVISRTSGVSWD